MGIDRMDGMTWQVDLIGEDTDVAVLATLAPDCGCIIVAGADGQQCLSGPRFAALPSAGEVRAEAAKALKLLNGLARLKYDNHHPVRLGASVSRLGPGGQKDTTVALTATARARAMVGAVAAVVKADGSAEATASINKSITRVSRIVADPKLVEIVEALSDDITWQRLRVAFEKINALVGKGDNAFVKEKYATQPELDRFKANVQDPRLSGDDAVHGKTKGALKGTKMSEQEGLAFVRRLLDTYLSRSGKNRR
jgi:hypothetical protein